VELKQIKELMAAMERTGTKRVSLKKDDFELTLERDQGQRAYQSSGEDSYEDNPMRSDIEQHRSSVSPARAVERSPILKKEGDPPVLTGTFVTSPMVGTLYLSPSPEDPAFVKVGDRIEKDTVVCIIEAMKVMNEVKAGVSGVVAEVMMENGHPVEFSTKLFRIE
jgi:acetyl-CoA carboxylase biotin carboxyl carrier protein